MHKNDGKYGYHYLRAAAKGDLRRACGVYVSIMRSGADLGFRLGAKKYLAEIARANGYQVAGRGAA